jgi:hemerythrin-like domain-containing protein
MLPIGPLMIEHRLIERMIGIMENKLSEIKKSEKVDPNFIDVTVDFIRTYADQCHHGKEEDILFRELKKKELKQEHKKVMEELIEEHRWGRKTTKQLLQAKQQYIAGEAEALDKIVHLLQELTTFYPKHIEKEDKYFFKPIMDYFSSEELDALLQEEYHFDQEFIHNHYEKIVSSYEEID